MCTDSYKLHSLIPKTSVCVLRLMCISFGHTDNANDQSLSLILTMLWKETILIMLVIKVCLLRQNLQYTPVLQAHADNIYNLSLSKAILTLYSYANLTTVSIKACCLLSHIGKVYNQSLSHKAMLI